MVRAMVNPFAAVRGGRVPYGKVSVQGNQEGEGKRAHQASSGEELNERVIQHPGRRIETEHKENLKACLQFV